MHFKKEHWKRWISSPFFCLEKLTNTLMGTCFLIFFLFFLWFFFSLLLHFFSLLFILSWPERVLSLLKTLRLSWDKLAIWVWAVLGLGFVQRDKACVLGSSGIKAGAGGAGIGFSFSDVQTSLVVAVVLVVVSSSLSWSCSCRLRSRQLGQLVPQPWQLVPQPWPPQRQQPRVQLPLAWREHPQL